MMDLWWAWEGPQHGGQRWSLLLNPQIQQVEKWMLYLVYGLWTLTEDCLLRGDCGSLNSPGVLVSVAGSSAILEGVWCGSVQGLAWC